MPRSKKTVELPLESELKGFAPPAVIDFFRRYREAIDLMFKLLKSDITTIQIGNGSTIEVGDWIYFGDPNTDGTWRIGRDPSGNDWIMQRRESGTYTSKAGATA